MDLCVLIQTRTRTRTRTWQGVQDMIWTCQLCRFRCWPMVIDLLSGNCAHDKRSGSALRLLKVYGSCSSKWRLNDAVSCWCHSGHAAYTQYYEFNLVCAGHIVPDTIFYCSLPLVVCQFASWQFIKLKPVTHNRESRTAICKLYCSAPGARLPNCLITM